MPFMSLSNPHRIYIFLVFYYYHSLHEIQGYFEAHKMLAVTPSGSLIDPLDKDLNPDNSAQPCPLLTGLWEMALPNGNEKHSANRPKDDPRAFAARVLDYHVDG